MSYVCGINAISRSHLCWFSFQKIRQFATRYYLHIVLKRKKERKTDLLLLSHQVKNICLENRCLVWGVVMMVKLELLMSGREVCLCFYFWPSRSVYFTYPKNKQKQLRASHFLIYFPPCPTFVSLVYGACSYVVFFNLVFLGGFELGISTKLTRGPDQLFGFVS